MPTATIYRSIGKAIKEKRQISRFCPILVDNDTHNACRWMSGTSFVCLSSCGCNCNTFTVCCVSRWYFRPNVWPTLMLRSITLWRPLVPYGFSYKASSVRPLTLRAERQSAWMSKITNNGLIRSGTVYPYGNSGRQRVNIMTPLRLENTVICNFHFIKRNLRSTTAIINSKLFPTLCQRTRDRNIGPM